MRILIFGASITQGFWDSEGGWVQRLRKFYDAKKISGEDDDPPTIFNMGVSGDSTNELLERFTPETEARNRYGNMAIVFSIGSNDCRTKAGKPFLDTDRYVENLGKLLDQAHKYTDKILFVGLASCDEQKSNPVAWGDTGYTNERIWEFEQALRSFCEKNNVPMVKVFETFKEKNKKQSLIADGIHPNDTGHELITSLVRPELEKLLIY